MLFVQLEQRHALHIAKRFIRGLQGRLLHGVRGNRFIPVHVHQITHLLSLAQRAVVTQGIEFFQFVHLGADIRNDRQDVVLRVFNTDLRVGNCLALCGSRGRIVFNRRLQRSMGGIKVLNMFVSP